ncbi:RecB family exonuclease [Gracilibacillus thailandensis]|uniref:PD-(D/E)XK nuclease family protein n=1 Tax=Gracilibacillus thailandensis TaxID=563735 RepID=A0A6N7QZM9_9BACI|nr:PD-(D/E)XK nuclease family protein [Gracilibacillus thailandensis]MRI66180.1 PD-(D/E)XK nuclease family protein [Gracilibacillus thailandensis]
MKLFSFSRLKLYEQCPQRFYYKYILEKEEPVTKPLALGKAVHKSLEQLVKGTDFEEAIKQGLIECDFHEEVTPDEIRELVRKAPIQNLEGETELYFRIPLFYDNEDSPELQGYIDLVNGNRIFDYKTNRVAYNVLDNYQIALYAWALSQLKGFNEVQGSLLFLRQRRESSHVFDQTIMNEAVEWARNLVSEINFKLEMLEFAPNKWNELFPYKASSLCDHCPFVVDCYKQNSFQF